MSKTEIVTLLLSSAVLSGIVSTVLGYFLDLRKNKDSRNSQFRQEAYSKAIASISGASHTIFDYLLKKHEIDGRMNPMMVTEFVAAYMRALSPAILVANDEIKISLKSFPSLITEGAEIIEKLSKTTPTKDSVEAKDLLAWRNKIESLEDKIIDAMQKDVGLKR